MMTLGFKRLQSESYQQVHNTSQ